MDGRDELRAEVNRRREAADAANQAKNWAAEDRAKYEREVQEVKARLYEAAQLTIQALTDSAENPINVEVEPKPSGIAGLFGQPVHVDGWKVRWGQDEAIVCPDGTLFISRASPFQLGYSRTSFWEVIDKHLAEVGTYSQEGRGSLFERAFSGKDNEGAAASLRSELDRARSGLIQLLSYPLNDRGLSI
jgi:hypothetical protein